MRSLFLLSCLLPVMAIAAATPLESVTAEGSESSESIPQRMVSLSVKQDVAAACGTRPCRREN